MDRRLTHWHAELENLIRVVHTNVSHRDPDQGKAVAFLPIAEAERVIREIQQEAVERSKRSDAN